MKYLLTLLTLTLISGSLHAQTRAFKATHETQYEVTDTSMNTIHSLTRQVTFTVGTRYLIIAHIATSTLPGTVDSLPIKTLTNQRATVKYIKAGSTKTTKFSDDVFCKVTTWNNIVVLIFEGSHVTVKYPKAKGKYTLFVYDL